MSTPLPTVCFLTGTLNAFAGAERMTAVIANALAERGYRVLVLSLWDRTSVFPLHEGVEHHALFEQRPSFKRAYVSTVLGIRRFVREQGIDVLIEVDTMLTLFTLPATSGMKVRRIAWEHCHFDEDLGRKARRVARWLAAKTSSAVVVLTERDRQRWLNALGQHCRIATIGNPLPFAFPAEPAQRGSRIVLAVGRLVRAKGFDVLLDAWARVAPAHPDWRLVIVGEGEERDALEAQIRSLALGHCVDLPGASSEIASYYGEASIFCLSSRYEGFGLVLMEAMAFGLPVVSTNCEAGPKALIRDGVNGLQVPAEDALALGAALSRLMQEKHLCEALSSRARDDARRYEIDAICPLWQNLLGDIQTV
ncbi:glycosyltransferase family 4 protein [Cupriavidus metallidurans]|uniref:Glycosyltransferase, group 1 (Probably involved in lipopolysaccharide biosynthesis) n=1 Tax=Cupriavidus metallidurans (strain ATCC 43123 / DSM 2839 / NBRC 102507 / CH34) TaxID=266264 RepID=Q1LJT2_CUPMC|nr:glycosyltransferase family 4 protein [Cupriavidus metallidurans]ABF09594.1 putative glycosyltransferase, group 1 (probably involved in lipopolysaccharide biosynthesis) [Cupriavidus metallidurans CH34]QGS29559.1 glycosyltransferase [Cupriavidus metallidurans]